MRIKTTKITNVQYLNLPYIYEMNEYFGEPWEWAEHIEQGREPSYWSGINSTIQSTGGMYRISEQNRIWQLFDSPAPHRILFTSKLSIVGYMMHADKLRIKWEHIGNHQLIILGVPGGRLGSKSLFLDRIHNDSGGSKYDGKIYIKFDAGGALIVVTTGDIFDNGQVEEINFEKSGDANDDKRRIVYILDYREDIEKRRDISKIIKGADEIHIYPMESPPHLDKGWSTQLSTNET